MAATASFIHCSSTYGTILLTEIHELQNEIYNSGFSFGDMDRDERLEHIDNLTTLLDMATKMTKVVDLKMDHAYA